jgi:hypothetical protein
MDGPPPTIDHEWERWAAQTVRGGRVAEHRSLRRGALPRHLPAVVLLPAIFTLCVWFCRGPIGRSWAAVLQFWLERLQLSGAVASEPVAGWPGLVLPALEVTARAPTRSVFAAILIATAGLLVGARFIPDRALPLRSFIRFACFIQGTALLFFALAPERFPYALADQTRDAVQVGFALLLLVPWVHALVYYVFDFTLLAKATLTLLTLAFLTLAVPFQVAAQAYLLSQGSLLLLPILYFLFGLPLLILGCIALYGWGMSWRPAA